MAEGWYQLRQTVHLFNSELFAFDIHLVSDNAAKIPRRRADVKIEKLWQRSVGHFRKADGGTFWRAPKPICMEIDLLVTAVQNNANLTDLR